MPVNVQGLEINRDTPVQRIHLHYEGRSMIETFGPRAHDAPASSLASAMSGSLASATASGLANSLARDLDSTAAAESEHLVRSSSWVDVRQGFLRDPDSVFESVLENTSWAQGEIWRYERYVAEQRLGAMIREQEPHVALRQTGMHLRSAYSSPLRGVAAILYRDGSDFQGLHSDRSMRWLDNTLIAILVLGEARPFRLRPRRPYSKAQRKVMERDGTADAEDVELAPGRGDLIVLGGRSQRDWLHGVPASNTQGQRISLIWRWTSRTGQPDPGPAYGEGEHYSDASERPFRRRRYATPQLGQ